MSGDRISSLRNPWFTASIGITAAIAIVAAIAGFAWLPLQQQGERFRGVWDAICSAAGLVRNVPSNVQIVGADYPTTRVEVIPQMLQGASAESIGRGATLALRCTMCHGARGLSQADSPNLAGQSPVAIYKQLNDFKTGARTSAVMAPLMAGLSDADMRDLAAYYAYYAAALRPSPHRRCATPHRRERCTDARDRALWGLSWRPRQQGWRGMAQGTARGLSAHPTRGFLVRHSAQRHRRADAQHRARVDSG
jgi:cytochrome c553